MILRSTKGKLWRSHEATICTHDAYDLVKENMQIIILYVYVEDLFQYVKLKSKTNTLIPIPDWRQLSWKRISITDIDDST